MRAFGVLCLYNSCLCVSVCVCVMIKSSHIHLDGLIAWHSNGNRFQKESRITCCTLKVNILVFIPFPFLFFVQHVRPLFQVEPSVEIVCDHFVHFKKRQINIESSWKIFRCGVYV